MTVKEVISSPEFKDVLGGYISNYEKSRDKSNLKPGERFRRTPIDGIKDLGLFSVEKLKEEFFRIDQGQSSLSCSKRRLVAKLVIEAAKETYNRIEKKGGGDECK